MVKTTYTLGEAAELLSCHKETLRRAILDGNLRAARLGRGYRISRIDLEAFWSACGGGELFPREEIKAAEVAAEHPVNGEIIKQEQTPSEKKHNEQEQLLLPTTR